MRGHNRPETSFKKHLLIKIAMELCSTYHGMTTEAQRLEHYKYWGVKGMTKAQLLQHLKDLRKRGVHNANA